MKREKYNEKDIKILIFTLIFLNADISVNIQSNVFIFSLVVLNSIMEGTVSQIFYLGPRSNFMESRKLNFQKIQRVSRF